MPPAPPVIALRDAAITFGGRPLFSGITLTLGRGERVALVGANGSGKSTILKALSGQMELDAGTRFLQPGTRIGYLSQSPDLGGRGSVADFVAAALAGAEADDYRIARVLDHLDLDPARDTATLSGGEGRRAAMARALVAEPDVLLLDEPTNHLDLPTIEWLEQELAQFPGGILMISHDRAFLKALSRRVLWLDRGRLFEMEGGFAGFEDWSANIMAQEAAEARRLEKKIEQEEYWMARGVTARRSRNEGRRRGLMALRKERAEALRAIGRARLELGEAVQGGQLVIEAERIGKSFAAPDGGQRVIVKNFSTRIQRGDRIGIIGPNGAGKTTLIKLLTGAIAPDEGRIRLGTNVVPLYLDQRRESFDLDRTLWQTLAPGGGDSIIAHGRQRHVVAYLRDFLFDEKQATMPVRALSGGERARLLLAKLFAQPANFIILDEPTNDLDMDTLDLLQEVLSEFDGTVMVVSHDRDFLDRLATSIIAVEGDGVVEEYPGGYSDYLDQRKLAERHAVAARPARKAPAAATPASATPASAAAASAPGAGAARWSSKDQRSLDQVADRMTTLEAEISTIEAALADPDLYSRDPGKFEKASQLLAQKRNELETAELRWLELEELRAAAG
ncbi:MAG: ABC-F family ATP-binding cassette domain-containing protein [Rhodospirillaceae bacterium]|nr:ABC-F family ATP-binding cassette domain-containing protein [Rhodospirillaceae bacterium]